MFDPNEGIELKPKQVRDRPRRQEPRKISDQAPAPWLASTSKSRKMQASSAKQTADKIVSRVLPIVGILFLIGIGLGIATVIMGIYT